MARKKKTWVWIVAGVGVLGPCLMGMIAGGIMMFGAKKMEDNKREAIGRQVEVVAAARDIKAGTLLEPSLITTKTIPVKFLPPNPILKSDVDIYLDTPLSMNVHKGAMILTSDFSL